jgi:zinc transporter ZupT
MKHNVKSNPSRLLAEGFGMMMGEAAFAVNGPWLFGRFGLNAPLAAAAGCLLGAAVGYVVAALVLQVRERKHVVAPAPAIRYQAMRRAA